jgi:tetratricopeptide (TPR) repeat protein
MQVQFSGLATRNASNKDLSRGELGDIVDTLKEILNTSPLLGPKLVAYIHSTIGLVRQLRGESEAAIHAFMKALWIATATHDPDTIEIGLTVHRLGIVHGRTGNLNEAVTMLEKALALYRSADLSESHPYFVSATNEIEVVRPKLMKDLWRAGSTPSFRTVNKEIESLQRAVDRRLSS